MPERIDITVPQGSAYVPYSPNNVFPQNQSKEKWRGSAIGSDAAVLHQNPLDKPTYKDREPHPVHSPTAGQWIRNRMQRPPEQTVSQSGHDQDKHKSASHESSCSSILIGHVKDPSLQLTVRFLTRPTTVAILIPHMQQTPERNPYPNN